MKSSGFRWEASAVELLAASFLADDEFCANAELVAANATNIRVITRKFFWFTDFLPYSELELGASALYCQQRELSSMHESNRATSCISQPGAGLDLLPQPLTTVDPAVSSVTCHVTRRGYGNCSGHRLFQQEENNLFRLRAEAYDSR